MDGGVFFDNVRIKAKACSHISREAPPLPPRCARFTEMYLERPEALYEVPAFTGGAMKALWQYKVWLHPCLAFVRCITLHVEQAHVAGRKRVLQPQALDVDDSSPSTVVLKSPKLCKCTELV